MNIKGSKNKIKILIIVSLIVLLILIGTIFVVNKIKDNKFIEIENELISVVKNYYETNPSFLPTDDNYIKELSISSLEEKRVVALDKFVFYNDVCSEESFVRIVKENNDYVYIPFLECGKKTSSSLLGNPEIILNGDDNIVLKNGDDYEELGVEKINIYSGGKLDVNSVNIDYSNVDFDNVGEYEIVYSIYDNNYNYSETVRILKIMDSLLTKTMETLGNKTVFSGDVTDNYLWYSGFLYRIVSIDKNNNTLLLVTDNNIINLPISNDNVAYENGDIDNWLNNVFAEYIDNFDDIVVKDSTWCLENISTINDNVSCSSNNEYKTALGLLGLNDYKNSTNNNAESYLKIHYASVLMNYYNNSSNNSVIVGNYINGFDFTTSIGIRPSFNIYDQFIISGDGSKENPYIIEEESNISNVVDIKEGEYIELSGFLFRKIEEDNNGIKFIMDTIITDEFTGEIYSNSYFNDKNTLNKNIFDQSIEYLNNNFVNRLEKSKLITNNYNFTTFYYEDNKVSSEKYGEYVYLSEYNQLFNVNLNNNEYQTYTYVVGSDYSIDDSISLSFISNNGFYFPNSLSENLELVLRPIITISKDLEILMGNGSKNEPYIIK